MAGQGVWEGGVAGQGFGRGEGGELQRGMHPIWGWLVYTISVYILRCVHFRAIGPFLLSFHCESTSHKSSWSFF